jgi:diguanylate cyclase (GGDEF)-like protein
MNASSTATVPTAPAELSSRRPTGSAGARRSLRTRWNRAFATLSLALVLGGVVGVAGTWIVVQSYSTTAHRLEAEATILAELREAIVQHALVTASATGAEPGIGRRAELDASIRTGFTRGIANSASPGGRAMLRRGYVHWAAFVDSTRAVDPKAPRATRAMAIGTMVAVEVPKVLTVVDRAGAASRADSRKTLARMAGVERAALAGWVAVSLLAFALMIRLARRLSSEVLQPVGHLRDSANQLAAGHLSHRVVVGRDDELGELGTSFNAMAAAIAGSQRTLSRQANHDSLTGLANRAGFRARVNDALARPERRDGTQAVLFVDLDDFKDVNDLLGHPAGDEVLRAVAERLRTVVRPGDLVARLGGDEFAVLLDGIPDAAAAYGLAGRAVAALTTPVEIAGTAVHVSASIGLAMRQDGSDLDDLMREADIAMYSAKALGKSRVERYEAQLGSAVVEHQALKADVDYAAIRGELVLDYQPVVDTDTGEYAGLEALVRWQHPTRGLLPPSAFIALAESTGAIVGIGTWVLRRAARQVRAWQRRYNRPDLWVSVNVSVRELEAPNFTELVTEVLRTTGLDPRHLVIEVTESVLADPSGGAAAALERLRHTGIRVALDDFGTGHSSISYLLQLPVDVLKIDRSFVSGPQAGSDAGVALLQAIVGLGQRLGLEVIPEGIERPTELSRLRALGCAIGQGFLLSRPVSAGEIDERLSAPASYGPVSGSVPVALLGGADSAA